MNKAEIEKILNTEGDLPLTAETVLAYLEALKVESRRRNALFPQCAEEVAKDENALDRIYNLITWYDKNAQFPNSESVRHTLALRHMANTFREAPKTP